MLNNKNESVSLLPKLNFDGRYLNKTYTEMIEEISPEEIDELYYYLEQLAEKNMTK